MPVQTFYPSLKSIFSIDSLPEELSFLSNSINNVLDTLFYKNYSIHRSKNGAHSYYQIDIITKDYLGLELGAGFKLILNPSSNQEK